MDKNSQYYNAFKIKTIQIDIKYDGMKNIINKCIENPDTFIEKQCDRFSLIKIDNNIYGILLNQIPYDDFLILYNKDIYEKSLYRNKFIVECNEDELKEKYIWAIRSILELTKNTDKYQILFHDISKEPSKLFSLIYYIIQENYDIIKMQKDDLLKEIWFKRRKKC